MKPISFYPWLAKTGQLDMDFYQPCNSCDGEGYTIEEDDYEVGYRVTCESCKGTGNALYREYLRQVEEDKKLLNDWIYQNMQLSQANVSDKGGKVIA